MRKIIAPKIKLLKLINQNSIHCSRKLAYQKKYKQGKQSWRKSWYSETEKRAIRIGIDIEYAEEGKWKKEIKEKMGSY